MFNLMPRKKERTALLPRMHDPFRLMAEDFPALFNRFFSDWPLAWTEETPRMWGYEMEENDKEVVVRFELPGFEAKELAVHLTGEVLTVEAEHKEESEEKKGEGEKTRRYAKVRRSVTLPAGVDGEKVEALYKNGVLELHLNRRPEAVGRRIEVKT